MTARISLIAAVIAVLILSCDTERNIAPVFETYFTKYYGEDDNQYGVDLAVGSDGSMVMLGRTEIQANDESRSFVAKVDGNGAVLWQKQLSNDDESPVDVEFDSRNDIIVVSNVAADSSIRLTRINQGGSIVDTAKIKYPNVKLVGTAVTELSDGNFIVTGYAGPNLTTEGEEQLLPPDDRDDLLIYQVDPGFSGKYKVVYTQGGEHYGKIVKLFESKSGPLHYYRFGDSDRPFVAGAADFRQTCEVGQLDEFYQPANVFIQSGPTGEVQLAREVIQMPVVGGPGYLMVGNSGSELFKQIFIAQYYDGTQISSRFSRILPTQRSAEGISVAYGDQETMFVLADEKQDNNNHDIYLVKLDGEGKWLGETRFGSVEGDDRAGAVRVLPDQRIAVFGTMELETQKKMMLTLVSPQGTFSE